MKLKIHHHFGSSKAQNLPSFGAVRNLNFAIVWGRSRLKIRHCLGPFEAESEGQNSPSFGIVQGSNYCHGLVKFLVQNGLPLGSNMSAILAIDLDAK